MSVTVSTRQPTSAIINAIIAAVTAVQLPDAGGVAFQRVAFFDSEKLVDAFKFLFITEQRVCVIVPLEERFETVVQQPQLTVKRTLPVMILVSDRVLGDAQRTIALLGSNAGPVITPGAQGLMELVLLAVTGLLLPNPGGVLATPQSSCVMTISDKDRATMPGRVAVAMEFHCQGGTLTAQLGRSPIT